MRIAWSIPLDAGLAPEEDRVDAAWQEFHEASKLPAAIARAQASRYTTTPQEAFAVSRAFRQFPGPDAIPLPAGRRRPARLSDVLAGRRSRQDLDRPLSLGDLSVVLTDALGPTRILTDEQTDIPTVRRAWPSAGGLYPLDCYLIARDVVGIGPGCFHVNTIAQRLEPVPAARDRDVTAVLRDGWFWQSFVTEAAAVIVLVAVFERTIAKYGERGYRFALLDAGHAAQNLLLVATQQQLPATAIGGFDDDALAGALGLDGLHEAVVETVALGGADADEGHR
jgi:SagB-type dehydrogenase family enzyme